MPVSFEYNPQLHVIIATTDQGEEHLPIQPETFLGYPRRKELLVWFKETYQFLAKRFEKQMLSHKMPPYWEQEFEQGVASIEAHAYECMLASNIVSFFNNNRNLFLQRS